MRLTHERLSMLEVCPDADRSLSSCRLRSNQLKKFASYAPLLLGLWLPICAAAQQPSPPAPSSTPAQTAPPAGSSQNYKTSLGTTPDEPYSVEIFYWFAGGEPALRGGKANITDTTSTATGIDFIGKVHRSPGIVLSMPAGKGNSLHFSYFQNVGTGNQTAQSNLALFGTGFVTGDYLATRYRVQNAKISWDFLTWPTPLNGSSFRFRTLWEVQYTTAYSSIDAPLKPISYDSSGSPISNTGYGTRSFVYPTFGVAVSKDFGKRFRLEGKASGFGLPHHATLWDAEASATVRVGPLDVIGAYKGFHFKTSPQSDQYFMQTLSGAYVGLRWNFGKL